MSRVTQQKFTMSISHTGLLQRTSIDTADSVCYDIVKNNIPNSIAQAWG